MHGVNAHTFHDDGIFPNNARLPLLHYTNAVPRDPEHIERLFRGNDWDQDTWRDIVYPFHHYHTTAHEVLGAFKGYSLVRFGGERDGLDVRFEAGACQFDAGQLSYIPRLHGCTDIPRTYTVAHLHMHSHRRASQHHHLTAHCRA